ncbi:MAG TPA: hypothetical protein VFL97_01430, partial [Nitrococcus sp.]|nr:hypothetical protein [Nitrococcus sp.]
ASPEFWECFRTLPARVQELARRNYELLNENPRHSSLHFKKIGRYRSVRIGLQYRALGVEIPEGVLWFWIGSHADYDKLLG